MISKQYVLSRCPNAKVIRTVSKVKDLRIIIYIIKGNYKLGEGKTVRKAWIDAHGTIIEYDKD